jgi:hypothetical protein
MISPLISSLIALLLPLVSTRPYLDPGSGSYILQMLLAAVVGSLFLIKIYWKKIKSIFKKNSSEEDDGEEE